MTELAVRGPIYTLVADPFLNAPADCVVYESDGLMLIGNGLIHDIGSYADLRDKLPADIDLRHYPNAILMPGFVDAHIHYPQVEIIGSYGAQLLEWLNKYTFPAEARFVDGARARRIAEFFIAELLRNGSTSASVFCTSAPGSVDAIFEAAQRRNMLLLAGVMMMDRHAPANLVDTAQSSYDDSKALIDCWHKRGRCLYTVTPRFALTSSPAQLELAGALMREHSDVRLQSHISENRAEVARAAELYPARKHYTDIYEHYGLLNKRAIYGHGIHLSEDELRRFHETGANIAHCPTSNFFIGSGLFDMAKARDAARTVTVGLGTDVGGGTSFSMLQTMNEAYKMAQLRGISLTATQSYYLATLGSAEALGVADRVGSLRAGCAADIIVLDPKATPLLELRANVAESLNELLFALMICADDRAIQATYVAGELVHERDAAA
ncbi:MAG: guanine deaminase [Chloroflexota bacterium]|nr:guanine deaminase [Chloroflexota bacterium]